MRKGLTITLIAIFFVLGTFGQTFARGLWPCLTERFDFPMVADISTEKVEKLKEIRERFRRETDLLRQEILRTRLELRRLYIDPQAKEEEIRAKHKELGSLLERLREKILERKLEERKVLSPEELKRFKDGRFGRFCRCG